MPLAGSAPGRAGLFAFCLVVWFRLSRISSEWLTCCSCVCLHSMHVAACSRMCFYAESIPCLDTRIIHSPFGRVTKLLHGQVCGKCMLSLVRNCQPFSVVRRRPRVPLPHPPVRVPQFNGHGFTQEHSPFSVCGLCVFTNTHREHILTAGSEILQSLGFLSPWVVSPSPPSSQLVAALSQALCK